MDNEKNVEQINKIVKSNLWYDFEIISYDGYNLKIGGSTESLLMPNMKYNLEIIFSDIFFISSLSSWSADIVNMPFTVLTGDEARDINLKYQVEQGYSIFQIAVEDHNRPLLVIAGNISYNQQKGL